MISKITTRKKIQQIAMGAASAALFLAAPVGAAAEDSAEGHCVGVNECKGQGACGGANHDCAGKNECKGKGWLSTTEEKCDELGGTFEAGDDH